MDLSDELAALLKRADLATENARRLMVENERWRCAVLDQFDYMYEISAEFRRRGVRIKNP